MYWQNSNFQLKHFIAGNCHTADEAYRVLKQQWEDRDLAVRNAEASQMRAEAKNMRCREKLTNKDSSEADQLEALADLKEMEVFEEQGKAVLDAAERERDYIQHLIDEVQPYRKYAHLPDHEAHQLAQEEEWMEELKWRAENFLGSQGFIPSDHLATMRMHPAWDEHLLPHVQTLVEMSKSGKNILTHHAPPMIEDHS